MAHGNGQGPKAWRRMGLTIEDEAGPAFRINGEPLEAAVVKQLRYIAETYDIDVVALAKQASGENKVARFAVAIIVAVPAFAFLVLR